MSILKHLFLPLFCTLVCHVASGYLSNFIFPWLNAEGKQSHSCGAHRGYKGEESCQFAYSGDSSLQYYLFMMLNPVIICLAMVLYDPEDSFVTYLKLPFTICKDMIKGIEVGWVKTSVVHRSILEDLVRNLKYKPYTVHTIDGYHVCFEDHFCIGNGSNGTEVFVGLGNDGDEVAVKRVNSKFSSMVDLEKEVLSRLKDNPNILTYRFKTTESKRFAYLVTDLQDKNLKQYVSSKEVSLPDLQKNGPFILRQILLGMNALHDENILHRDLKPENVLVNFQGKVASTNPKVVLGDFDICRKLQEGQETHFSIPRGADSWRALESLPDADDDDPLSESNVNEVSYTKKSDIQVLGMLFYFVLTKGKHPFGKQEIFRPGNISLGKSDLSDLTDDVAKDLIQWMIKHDINERPTVNQCLKHPYVRSPEENFRLVKAVGNEMEIKTKKKDSAVVRELNQIQSLSNWSKQIDKEVYDKFNHPASRYYDNGAEFLRFIRNVTEHWDPAVSVQNGTPQAYFQRKFPKLPMIVHRILRKDSSWCERDSLKDFF